MKFIDYDLGEQGEMQSALAPSQTSQQHEDLDLECLARFGEDNVDLIMFVTGSLFLANVRTHIRFRHNCCVQPKLHRFP